MKAVTWQSVELFQDEELVVLGGQRPVGGGTWNADRVKTRDWEQFRGGEAPHWDVCSYFHMKMLSPLPFPAQQIVFMFTYTCKAQWRVKVSYFSRCVDQWRSTGAEVHFSASIQKKKSLFSSCLITCICRYDKLSMPENTHHLSKHDCNVFKLWKGHWE